MINILNKMVAETNIEMVIEFLDDYEANFSHDDLKTLIQMTQRREVAIVEKSREIIYQIIKTDLLERFNTFDDAGISKLVNLLIAVNENIIQRIIEDYRNENADRKLRIIQIIGMLGKNEETEKFLFQALKEKESKLRATAIKVLGTIINSGKMSVFLDLLNDDDFRVRANLIDVLGDIGNPNVIGILLRYKNDLSNRVQANVVLSLWKVGYRDIDSQLEKMLRSKEEKVRISAAWVLGELGKLDKRFIKFLKYIINDDSETVRRNCIKSIIQIGGPVVKAYLKNIISDDILTQLNSDL